jgi:hypothetical protein
VIATGDRVPNAPLREAFLASGLSAKVVAERLGWMRRPTPATRRRGHLADDTRVRSALGLKRSAPSRHGRVPTVRQTLDYDVALQIARALDLDPVDVGL